MNVPWALPFTGHCGEAQNSDCVLGEETRAHSITLQAEYRPGGCAQCTHA